MLCRDSHSRIRRSMEWLVISLKWWTLLIYVSKGLIGSSSLGGEYFQMSCFVYGFNKEVKMQRWFFSCWPVDVLSLIYFLFSPSYVYVHQYRATTHTDIVVRAKKLGVDVKVIHNASVMNAVGVCGLQLYHYGETVSIPFFTETWRPDSFYEKIRENRKLGLHTLCLLGKWLFNYFVCSYICGVWGNFCHLWLNDWAAYSVHWHMLSR